MAPPFTNKRSRIRSALAIDRAPRCWSHYPARTVDCASWWEAPDSIAISAPPREKREESNDGERRHRHLRRRRWPNCGSQEPPFHVPRDRRAPSSGVCPPHRRFLPLPPRRRSMPPGRNQWCRLVLTYSLHRFASLALKTLRSSTCFWGGNSWFFSWFVFGSVREDHDTEDTRREAHGGAGDGPDPG